MVCSVLHSKDQDHVETYGIFDVFLKVWPACFLWGTGTAFGEIPPYLFSYAAVAAGNVENDAEYQNFENAKRKQKMDSSSGTTKRNEESLNIIERLRLWTLNFVEEYGFWGVLALSSWPNAAFDMCGICCGHFQMPFFSFFSAVWIGKAVIKVNLQALGMIYTFQNAENVLLWIRTVCTTLGITPHLIKNPALPVETFLKNMVSNEILSSKQYVLSLVLC
eukprot:g3933.t1